jgi:hypothetical protein
LGRSCLGDEPVDRRNSILGGAVRAFESVMLQSIQSGRSFTLGNVENYTPRYPKPAALRRLIIRIADDPNSP